MGRDLEDERHEKVGKSGLLSLRKRKLNGSLLAWTHGYIYIYIFSHRVVDKEIILFWRQ